MTAMWPFVDEPDVIFLRLVAIGVTTLAGIATILAYML